MTGSFVKAIRQQGRLDHLMAMLTQERGFGAARCEATDVMKV
jgi:hypothetical protein